MEAPGFPGLAALVELPSLAAPVGIRSAFGFLLKALGQRLGSSSRHNSSSSTTAISDLLWAQLQHAKQT